MIRDWYKIITRKWLLSNSILESLNQIAEKFNVGKSDVARASIGFTYYEGECRRNGGEILGSTMSPLRDTFQQPEQQTTGSKLVTTQFLEPTFAILSQIATERQKTDYDAFVYSLEYLKHATEQGDGLYIREQEGKINQLKVIVDKSSPALG